MKQRLREVALLRKAKLQKRIKSKSYHRRAKRRNMKEFEKDIALLRKNNPQAFAERLLEAERIRAKERASLRHRTGGRFAKMQRLRAKYDKEARDAVANMHDQARDLTKRRQNGDDDGDSDSVISEFELSSSEEEETDEEMEVDDADVEGEEDLAPHLASWWAKVNSISSRMLGGNPLASGAWSFSFVIIGFNVFNKEILEVDCKQLKCNVCQFY